jgi:hypothetical protein
MLEAMPTGAARLDEHGVGSVTNLVEGILARRIPPKIAQVVIRAVAVVVAALHTVGTWTHKGREDQRVHLVVLDAPAAFEFDSEATIDRISPRPDRAAAQVTIAPCHVMNDALDAADMPVVADLVTVFPADDGPPLLLHG